MSETVINSVAEFQAQLQELESDEAGLLYRGQADATWKVDCSAARRLTKDPAKPIEPQLINSLLVGYLEFLIAKARMRGLLPSGFSEKSPAPDLELLAQLQHQGAATGLIDFTHQPFVALWFACNESRTKDGAIYVLSCSETEEISNPDDLTKKIQSFYEDNKLWSWEPSALGHRIVAQSSVFVLGVSRIGLHKMEKFIVKARSKVDILTQLETVCGINEEMLFPDFPGYAVANAANRIFDIRRTVSYWQAQIEQASNDAIKAKAYYNCGVAYSAIKDFSKAIEQYSVAIEIDPGYALAFNNRGNAKAGLCRYEEAIADYDAAICISSEIAGVYVNRGVANDGLCRYAEAIEDYSEAIGIDPGFAFAYNNRGAAKAKLCRYAEAIEDYSEAIGIDPEYAVAYHNRGAAKAELGQHEEAIADYVYAIFIKPGYAEAYANRGVARKQLSQYEAAKKDFKRAQTLAQEQGHAELLKFIKKNLDDLNSEDTTS